MSFTFVFRRVQLVKIRAHTQEVAEREAALLNDGDWSVGEIDMIDKLDDEEQG